MELECLLVTCDPGLLGELRAGFGAHSVALNHRQDATSAIEFVSRRHLDGLVIDCDDMPGGREALAQLRSTAANKQSLVLAVVNGFTSPEAALDLGANFVLTKPVQQARLHSVMEVAIPKMEREHRRYFRYDVDLPVRFRNPLGQLVSARMKNISEGGMAIKLLDPIKLKGVVNVEFDFPSVDPQLFRAKGDVVWNDSFVMGLRFLYIEKDSTIALQSWLGSLEGQARFRDFTRLPH